MKKDLGRLTYQVWIIDVQEGDMIKVYKYTPGFYSTNFDLLNIAQNINTRGHKLKLFKKCVKQMQDTIILVTEW